MPWVRYDDQFANHPKVDQCSLAAIGLHNLSMTESGRTLSDGAVARRGMLKYTAMREEDLDVLAAELVAAGLWSETSDGWQIHDFLDYNPPAANVKAKRAKDAKRKAAGRAKQSANRDVQASSARTTNGHRAESSGPVPVPVPQPINHLFAKCEPDPQEQKSLDYFETDLWPTYRQAAQTREHNPGAKKKARERWKTLTLKQRRDVAAGLPNYIAECDRTNQPMQHLSTFLLVSNSYWEDFLEPPQPVDVVERAS